MLEKLSPAEKEALLASKDTTLTEEDLYERFSREHAPLEPVQYEFTTDRALLHQYYQLREVMYRKIFRTDRFHAVEDVYDKFSHTLIARRGKLVVGGARITVREPDEEFLLPMETEGFNIRNLPQTAGNCKLCHCEISRFAILSDKYEKEIMQEMVKILIEKMVDLNVHHLFIKADYAMARNWRKMGTINGLTSNHIYHDVQIPEHPLLPEVNWRLLRIDVVPVVAPSKMPNERLATLEQ